LTCAAKPDVPVALRSKWKEQVVSTVELLHKAGVIWGDVKADIVLIDDWDDAWVVDFGGSYLKRWVHEESAETLAGDAHGLAKIVGFLDNVGGGPRRCRDYGVKMPVLTRWFTGS
jgi:tRNA A-37 threonylcarbamoyl transferase component Bud32